MYSYEPFGKKKPWNQPSHCAQSLDIVRFGKLPLMLIMKQHTNLSNKKLI